MRKEGIFFFLELIVLLFHSSIAQTRRKRTLQGFGVIGGNSSNTNSSGTGGGDGSGGSVSIDGTTSPTSAPTELGGVVVLPDTPVAAPVASNNSSQNGMSSLVFSYSLELYTSSLNQVEIAVASVNNKVTSSLRGLIKRHNVSMSIGFLSDDNRGRCNSTKNLNLPFPSFPVCNIIETEINAKMDISKYQSSIVYDSFVQHIRNVFIPGYNHNSTLAKLAYLSPIEVSAKVNISMFGVQTIMNTEESKFFVDTLQAGLLGIFLNGSSSNSFIVMNLENVEVLHQVSSSGKRVLQANDNTVEKILAKEKYFNHVGVLITTLCSRNENCTDRSLQAFLDMNAPSYGLAMLSALVVDPNLFYFDDLIDLQIGTRSPPELPPLSDVPSQSTEEVDESDKMPLWLVALIVVNVVIVSTVILYICVRKVIRHKQGDKIHDLPEEETSGQQRMSFAPAPAPTFQQLQELNSREMVYDSNTFSKRGQNKAQSPPEYEDYSENRSCDDQFSVEAGSFGGDGYDINQWNNSYSNYT